MLALKECLIREGVLNLDNNPEKYHRPYYLNSSRSIGSMDIPRYRKTIAASSDLSTAPATATAKTQEKKQLAKLLPNQDKQQTNSEDSSSQRSSVAVKYRGQHPHFHHHTTPAYYTDLQLRIHTPNVSDAGALNENYRSVYTTPSTQLVEQRSFPKTSTASSVAPVSFFRGDSASSEGRAGGNRSRRSQPRTGSEGRFFRYSQGSVSPTKGEVSHEGNEPITNHNSPITSSTVISSCNPVEQASPVVNASASGRNSRHKQRFHSRSRRAVRVRSESRPISALYDIICKEKNLDVGHTSSSSSSSNEEQEQERQKEKEQSKEDQSQQDSPKITTDKLATFWPLHHHYLNPQMSSSGNPKQPKQLQLPGARGAPSSSEDEEGALHALHSSHKVTNLSVKANSLPPPEDDSIALSSPLKENSSRLSLRLAKSLERAAPVSEDAPSYSPGEPICTERLFVEPPKMPKPATRHTLHDDDDGEEYDNTLQFNQCDVMDHWGQELRSSAGQELVNGVSANGHQSDPEAESPTQAHPSSLQPVEPKPHQSHHHHHQATNARRFITRTTRSASRQSSAGHSPPPFVAGHSDSSCSSPSPTRKRNNKQLQSGAATVDTQSSANGNSSAYETAATTVMTHGPATPPPSSQYHHQHHQHQQHLQLYPTASVPKTPSVESQSGAIVTSCPASSNAISASSSSSSQRGGKSGKCSISCNNSQYNNNNCNTRQQRHSNISSSNISSSNNNTNQQQQQQQQHLLKKQQQNQATPMPPLATATTSIASSSPAKRRKNPVSPLRLGSVLVSASATTSSTIAPPLAIASPLLSGGSGGGGGSCSSSATSPQTSPAVRTTKASRLRAAALDKKKEEEQQRQRYSSPVSPRNGGGPSLAQRRLSSSELSPKSPGQVISGFNSEPGSSSNRVVQSRSASQPAETPPTQRRQPLVAISSGLSMKQSLSELHFTGGAVSPPKALAECTLRMRPRSSTMSTDQGAENGTRDHLANLQLSPVQKHKRTPEVSPRRLGDRDKSAKRKSNLNRSLTEEATKDGDEAAASSSRRRRRRELGMARPLVPGDDEALRDLLHSPLKSSCSESTTTNTSKSESTYRPTYPAVRHPEVPVRTMTAVLPAPRPLHAPVAARNVTQKFNERTKTDLAEIKKIAEQSEQQQQQPTEEPTTSQKLSAILRRKSTDEGGVAGLPAQNSPPAPNQIVSILKKKEHGLGDCNSSASSNASPVTFSSSVMDPPLAGAAARCKRQGILKKRSSLDESRYYSRSHSPDERSILIKSARRNSLEEAGTGLSPAHQGHGILKQSSYDSSKSDGCPSANESQPHSILKKKDSLSTPSDGGCHKHVSISQAVTLAAAELAAHDGGSTLEDGTEEPEIRPILKQESTSSEEAVRPPKPILKKKSFGEADEPEMIRPILKSSRKSSREEFDLSGLDHDGNAVDSLSSILKSDSPSKRRSLGSTSHDLEESNNSLLKRRTRSLERQDAPPVMDLAAALDAISTSQAAPSTPVDFVTTPSSISVAERIKRMEMLSSPTARVAGGPNGSWESPLESATKGEQLGATPRLLKPSVLRRDLQRERYKTQPVTSEEKSFFKANSAPFDISATSAFKPTKPLDIRLSHALPHPPLISPITGQPLSHVPAPLLLSSSTHSGTGGATSFYRLTRSSTQPLQSPRVVHLASQGTTTNPLARQNSINDTSSGSVNLSEQLTLSLGTDSEQHIFEMSGLEEEDSAIQSLSDETAASATSAAATATATDTTTTAPSSGLTRSNSVRARANMFQQLQEQSRTPRATTGSSGTRHSPPAATTEVSPPRPSDHSLPSSEELSTPNTTLDAEFEPSSLSLAERLAFFSSLCGNNNSGTNSASGRYRSRTSSYSRSPPIDRTTPRSSTTASSSVSVTPTPMDYSPIPHEKEPSSLTLESIIEPVEQEQVDAKTKEPVLSESPLHNGFNALSRSATDPTNAATPIRTIRLRTVGKLVLPESFRNDRNNNTKTSSNNSSPNWNTLQPKLQTLNSIDVAVTVRSIGKIKSPFIEKQQEKMTNGTNSSDSGSDSGKENCASNHQQQEHQQQQDQDRETAQKVSEVRRKINRLVQQQQYQPPPAVNRRHTTEITSITMSVGRTPNVDDRYAKYFGVKRKDKDSEDDIENETYNSTTLLKTQSLPPTQSHSHHNQVEATNALVRLPITITVPSATAKRREMLKRSRPASMDHYTNGCISPTSAMPSPKRAHSPNNRLKATISNFEDIVVTPDELQAAGKDFKRLCGEILG
ncbi:serine/arginine repetitive matrix protein 2-like isoform X6 [Drosophila serrata]|uniref:serine/arginine repetitive matrix protein 2-like isoform X6 n=1 Tax=Drosophila serrata TaxID=7274 RepID=UPI000A1CF37C|nr:serine/arginine repetitive matrix protein 2-like isoform X6 [Drosophila serrata]